MADTAATSKKRRLLLAVAVMAGALLNAFARAASELKQLMAGAPVDRGYCDLPAFGGRMPMNAGGSLEILFTPGRVTIATEGGLVRRLHVRDTPLPGASRSRVPGPPSRTGKATRWWSRLRA